MFMNFYLLKFVFNYESPLCYLNGEVSEQDETNTANGKTQGGKASSPTHVTYTFSSDSEDSFNNDVFPCELMVTSSDGEEWEMMKPPPFEHLNGMPMQNGNRYYANQRNGFFPRDDETTGKRRKTEMNSQKESPNERKQYMHVSAKVKIMPLLKIKYVYFSMVDMNPSLTKLVLANNNLVIIYDTVKRRYNLMYFKNVISTIKISDENFLCIGFLNGFIDIFLFDQVMQNDQDSAEDMLKRNAFVGEAFGGGKGSSRKMNFMLLLKAIQNAYPYIPGYEVAHYRKNRELDGEVHGEMHGDMGSEDEGEGGIQSSSTIPYIDFRLRKDKIVDMQKVHVVKYKWHSHAVYDITIDGRKVISCGEEAVVLIYDIDSGVNEYIPHLGSPCYYSYVNKEKNLIICSSLKNTIHFINYNHRLFFYSYVGLHMPLSLRHLFSNYVNVYESIKNSVKIFEGQICSLYNYSLAGSTPAGAIEEEEGINGGVLNGDASMNPLANCDEDQSDSEGMTSDYSASSDAGEGIQDGITSGEKSRGNLTRGDHRSKGCEREEDLLGIPDEGIELSSSGEDQQGPLDSNPGGKEKGGKKTIISFKEIQEDIERSIYNHTNVQNNLYKKYQMLFYCDSNKGLVFSFLTSFSNIQLYNVEKDKHVKFVCPLQLTYKSRSSVEAVNDLELLFFSFTQSRHLLMTIERRNYQLEEACENKDEALVEAFFTFKIWRIVSNKLDYEPIYEQSITCEKVTETHEQQGRNEQEPPQNNCREDLGEEQLEKYRMIINHPFLSIFLVLECEGDMNVWCLEKSERIFDDTVYTDYEVDVYQTQDNSNYYRETRRLIHLASVYAGDSDDCNQKKSQMCQPKEDYEKEDAKEGEEGDQGDVNQRVTVIKRINHKNHPILGGDITSDGKILCICHDKIITIWDLTTLRVMAIINHTIYTGLNEFLFRLYKGVEIIQTDTDKGETKGYVPYMCFFAFDTIFIYSLYEFHLVYQKKIKNGIIEYVKFDKYNCSFVAIGVTKRLKGRSNQRGSTRPSTIVQKNYLYEFTSNVLKKRKLFYSSRDRPIVALDFAPLNERKNIPLSSFQPCTMLVALNSKFQVCTFYINTYAEFMELS